MTTTLAPTVAVGGIAFNDAGAVLLVRRARPPAAGKWTIPGGRVELGETLVAACVRELAEETSVRADIGPQVTLVERFVRDDSGAIRYHFVIVDFLVTRFTGEPVPGSDANGLVFASADQLDEFAARDQLTEGLVPVIDQARALRARVADETGGRAP
jgi:8-oxo-dGTP diphosphatase